MKIVEAEQKEFMSKREEQLKRQIIALLKDDGKGHHHALFADRLKDFTVKIITDNRICPTASMDFENGIIRINAGFLNCPPPKKGEKFPALFLQLSVLMRHELAHALMMHQIRYTNYIEKKYGKKGWSRIKLSKSLHELENIIADFEISNKRYTDEDKETVRNMWLNGRTIGGLVTEEHRQAWQNLKLEDMMDEMEKEISNLNAQIQRDLQAGKDSTDISNGKGQPDTIKYEIANTHYYLNKNGESNFISRGYTNDVIKDFIDKKALLHFAPFDMKQKGGIIPCIVKISSIFPEWQDIIKNIYNGFLNTPETKNPVTDADLDKLLDSIVTSTPTAVIALKNPYTKQIVETLYTPEEKFLAVDTLKEIRQINKSYEVWFAKVQKALQDPTKYSNADLQELADMLK